MLVEIFVSEDDLFPESTRAYTYIQRQRYKSLLVVRFKVEREREGERERFLISMRTDEFHILVRYYG